uniref:Uncharacterized protein n=1 Tax=Steinernema glaseri TaxID=37863 RepID=A0A1I7YT76_9BILA
MGVDPCPALRHPSVGDCLRLLDPPSLEFGLHSSHYHRSPSSSCIYLRFGGSLAAQTCVPSLEVSTCRRICRHMLPTLLVRLLLRPKNAFKFRGNRTDPRGDELVPLRRSPQRQAHLAVHVNRSLIHPHPPNRRSFLGASGYLAFIPFRAQAPSPSC